MSLIDTAERIAAIDHSAIQFLPERCLHSLDRFSECQACYSICPEEAITPGKPPVFEAGKCARCLACLPVCPVGAFESDDAVVNLLNVMTHLAGEALELLCEKNLEPDKGISEQTTGIHVRGCLAGLGTGAYLAMAAFEPGHIFVRAEACPGCEWHDLAKTIERQLETAGQFLDAWGKFGTIECVTRLESPRERPLWEAANPPLSRRDLFRMLKQQGKVTMARAVEKDLSAAGHRLGRDRLRLIAAVQHYPPRIPGENKIPGELNFAEVTISETCTACGVCGRACPTGALLFKIDESQASYRLNFNFSNCIGCEICMHVCAASAIRIDHAAKFPENLHGETITLQEGELVKCEHCGTWMANRSNIQLCPLCEYRQSHPFGSMVPPIARQHLQPKQGSLTRDFETNQTKQ